ncbi:MAG: carotenoid biosynthesis protein [Haloarculaceae archaeon]
MNLAYPAFSAAMLVASALCLRDAAGDRTDLALYVTALVYGLILEKATVVAFDAYTYPAGEYLLAPLRIPLAIALGWSAVVYAGVATARGLAVPRVAVPSFVALYALHVDLAMDAVAIRVPYWTWSRTGEWFGVPLGNFFGWFCVAFLLPAYFLALSDRVPRPALRGPAALVLSVGTLVALLEAWTRFTDGSAPAKALVLVGVALAAGAVLAAHPPRLDGAAPRVALAATLVFHLFFLGVLLRGGFYRAQPWLLAVSLAMLAVGVGIHLAPSLADHRRSLRPAAE